jgi:hypothetical protein
LFGDTNNISTISLEPVLFFQILDLTLDELDELVNKEEESSLRRNRSSGAWSVVEQRYELEGVLARTSKSRSLTGIGMEGQCK